MRCKSALLGCHQGPIASRQKETWAFVLLDEITCDDALQDVFQALGDDRVIWHWEVLQHPQALHLHMHTNVIHTVHQKEAYHIEQRDTYTPKVLTGIGSMVWKRTMEVTTTVSRRLKSEQTRLCSLRTVKSRKSCVEMLNAVMCCPMS